MRRTDVVEHARYIAKMAELLAERVESRESKRSSLNTYPSYGFFGIDGTNNPTAIRRMIVQLRVELLSLNKEVQ